MFKKRCKSNKNKTNIQFFHELFTGYFIKYFNPLPFHLIIKRKEPHDGGSNRCSNCSDSCFCARFCFSLVELTKIICEFNLDPVHFQPHRVPGTV